MPIHIDDDSALAAMPLIPLASLLALLCCIPPHMHRPHDLVGDDSSIDASAASPTGSLLLDCLVAFCSQPYRPMLLVTLAQCLVATLPVTLPGVILYFGEDQTALGTDATSFNTVVIASFTIVMMVVAVPVCQLLDRVNRPVVIYATAMLLISVAIAGTLLAKSFHLFWYILGLSVALLAFYVQSVLGIPCFLACVTNTHTIGRDINFMFALAAVLQSAVMIGLSPAYDAFESTTISGRERPLYAFAAYAVIIIGCSLNSLIASTALYVVNCMLQQRRHASFYLQGGILPHEIPIQLL